ncbi:MAG: SDR family NAD(P)-dependent oxidoreductase [Ignavibacteria bacterium]|nr:SDR family NAD(P)-dependent oxidoreductase [Ignavibacteria bacterium]
MNNSVVLITGASSGIGEACAQAFARIGSKLILFARRSERLEKIAEDLSNEFSTECIVRQVDVRDKTAVQMAVAKLPAEWKNIDVLVNNAGLSRGLAPFHEGSMQDWEEMIDTNLKGLIYMTKAVLPGMVAAGKGHVITIASIAGRQAYPGGNVYSASKAAAKMFSDSLQIDVLGTGVRICNVDPGLVETEFSEVRFRGDTERAAKVYQNYSPLQAADVADAVVWVVTRPAHVSIHDILIMPTDQATATLVNR